MWGYVAVVALAGVAGLVLWLRRGSRSALPAELLPHRSPGDPAVRKTMTRMAVQRLIAEEQARYVIKRQRPGGQ